MIRAAACALTPLTVILLIGLTSPSIAHARTEGRAWVSAGALGVRPGTQAQQWGPATQLGLELSLGEFWGLMAGVDLAWPLARDATEQRAALEGLMVSDLFVGATYRLDVFTYIPYVAVGVVGYLRGPPAPDASPSPDLGARVSVGMLWRPSRDWSLGGAIDLGSSLTQLGTFGLTSAARFDLSYHFDF